MLTSVRLAVLVPFWILAISVNLNGALVPFLYHSKAVAPVASTLSTTLLLRHTVWLWGWAVLVLCCTVMVNSVGRLVQPLVVVWVTEKLWLPAWLMLAVGGLATAPFRPEKLSVFPLMAATKGSRGKAVLLGLTVRLALVRVGAAGVVLTVTETLAVAVQELALLTVTE